MNPLLRRLARAALVDDGLTPERAEVLLEIMKQGILTAVGDAVQESLVVMIRSLDLPPYATMRGAEIAADLHAALAMHGPISDTIRKPKDPA